MRLTPAQRRCLNRMTSTTTIISDKDRREVNELVVIGLMQWDDEINAHRTPLGDTEAATIR